MKILRTLSIVLAALLAISIVGAGIVRLAINGPIGPLAGGRLDGIERTAPTDWTFSDEHLTIAVEVRPADPHSVTVVCFVSGGELYIPARDAAEKAWTQMALEEGRARVRIGDELYPVQLVKVEDASELESAYQAASEKYPRIGAETDGRLPEGVWLFRAERRS